MPINKEPFRKYNEEKKLDSFTVRLNPKERELLEDGKQIIEQTKDSTAIKTFAWVGIKVIHEEKYKYLLGILFKNKRNNERLGIADFE